MLPNNSFKDIMTNTHTNDFFIACKQSRIESTTCFYGCFYLGPFDETLSQTLANDLRRTLLSELTGLAITSIEIEGVLHKFSSLPGMKESVLDLICNLQTIVLKKQEYFLGSSISCEITQSEQAKKSKSTKKTYTGFLKASGPRVIKAMDLKLPPSIICVDPNQYLATLAEDGVLNMKFSINEGKNIIKQKTNNLDVGILKKRNILIQNFKKNLNNSEFTKETITFESIDNKVSKKLSLSNIIPLDAVFMPVIKVNCIIEENNLYSDFSTDFTKNQQKSIVEFKNINTFEQTLNTKSLFHLNNYNSIYQTCLLVKNNNSFHNLKIKSLPWQSNKFYYNLMPTNNINKIKMFLGSKPIIPSHLETKVPSLKTKVNLLNYKKGPHLSLDKSKSYNKITTILKKYAKVFKINPITSLNQQYLNIEYSKILELKPLRKKSQLIVEIWTNGSIHPRQALYKSFAFLANNFLKLQSVKTIGSMFKSEFMYANIKGSYFNQYSKTTSLNHNFSKTTQNYRFKELSTNSIISLSVPIGLLKLSLRTYTALKKNNIFTLSDLLKFSKKDLLKIKNLSIKSVYEIEIVLAAIGFSLKA